MRTRSAARCLFVRMKDSVATADMRRHSDTLRAANAATKEGADGGENGLSEAITRCRPRHRINDITPIGSSQSSWNSTG